MRLFIIFIILIATVNPLQAAVDIVVRGRKAVHVEDVYQQDGLPFIAVEDALAAVGLSGHWNSVSHNYRIKSSRGWAEISPASSYMKIGEDFYPLSDKPRFIDGRLRVTDNFILNQLVMLSGRSIHVRNLNPDSVRKPKDSGFDRLFSFLLNKKKDDKKRDSAFSAIAIDPGHGGLDTGVIAPSGEQEKVFNLAFSTRLAKTLKMQLGVPIYLSRDGDYELTPEQRRKNAAREDVDLWLLIHAQAAFSPEVEGVTLFIRPQPDEMDSIDQSAGEPRVTGSRLLAQELARALENNNIKVRGIYPSSRLSLGRGNLPTVQIELGFMSNTAELKNMYDGAYQSRLADALYAGIRRFATIK